MANGIPGPHPLITKNVDGTYTLYGYLGPVSPGGILKFYADVTYLDYFLEIPVTAIRHHADAPEDMLPHGGTILFVDGEAEIVFLCKLTLDETANAIVSGNIAKEYLSKARESAADGVLVPLSPMVYAITPGDQCTPKFVQCLVTHAYQCDNE